MKAALCLGALGVAIACGESARDDVSTTRPGGAGGALVIRDSGAGGAGRAAADTSIGAGGVAIRPDSSPGDAPSDACVATCPVVPGAENSACGNCVDDDGDGYVDMADPQCLVPFDASEELLHNNVHHFIDDYSFDCYFDADSGSGNDGCVWRYECDPLEPFSSCPYDPSQAASCAMRELEQSGRCAETCLPLVPNGCDCFGCCELPAGSGQYVWLGTAMCDVELADDPTLCPPCTPVTSCLNPCEECELCLGRGTLPAGCGDEPLCPPGAAPCGSCPSACPAGSFCLQGCCTL